MLGRSFKGASFALGAWVAARGWMALMAQWPNPSPVHDAQLPYQIVVAGVGGLFALVALPRLLSSIRRLMAGWISRLQRLPAQDIIAGTVGLIVGLLISGLVMIPLPEEFPLVGSYLSFIITVGITYTAVVVSVKKWDDFSTLIRGRRAGGGGERSEGGPGAATDALKGHTILDTSVIIDGRVADIARTSFLESALVVPEFVLRELQHIADSPDMLRRNRGRRGLDILKQMQKEAWVEIQVVDWDAEDAPDVDTKLVRLAKHLSGKVMTNDYNLNKVAELHGVPVLNINELANALKPAVLPGEEMSVQVIRDGKEQGQGVAYLDDGTMIVIEGGRRFIGSIVDVTVTSVLQTSAGRMIFARPNEPAAVVHGGRMRAARETG